MNRRSFLGAVVATVPFIVIPRPVQVAVSAVPEPIMWGPGFGGIRVGDEVGIDGIVWIVTRMATSEHQERATDFPWCDYYGYPARPQVYARRVRT